MWIEIPIKPEKVEEKEARKKRKLERKGWDEGDPRAAIKNKHMHVLLHRKKHKQMYAWSEELNVWQWPYSKEATKVSQMISSNFNCSQFYNSQVLTAPDKRLKRTKYLHPIKDEKYTQKNHLL